MAFTLHLYASFLALGIGGLILLMRKGTGPHRLMGITWVAAMALSALSSFWLGGGVLPLVGHLGPIHLLSLWVLVRLPSRCGPSSRAGLVGIASGCWGPTWGWWGPSSAPWCRAVGSPSS
ncbi:DUF2306 domain-containing protein [Halomonas jincaotanensis]|uniref:hypothetical protein n=1 Tax=Halomonas jincaotanensis TaxID=2810616 RepID=UPI002022DE14|nr:hypothetical protein [Halomonas jincaotanensis]